MTIVSVGSAAAGGARRVRHPPSAPPAARLVDDPGQEPTPGRDPKHRASARKPGGWGRSGRATRPAASASERGRRRQQDQAALHPLSEPVQQVGRPPAGGELGPARPRPGRRVLIHQSTAARSRRSATTVRRTTFDRTRSWDSPTNGNRHGHGMLLVRGQTATGWGEDGAQGASPCPSAPNGYRRQPKHRQRHRPAPWRNSAPPWSITARDQDR